MPVVLAVDPGTSVGFCTVDTASPTKLVLYGQIPPSELVKWMGPVLGPIFTEVVCEKFIIGNRTRRVKAGDIQDTLDVEGWLRLECERRGVWFTTQRNGDTLAFSTDEKLKALGWWDLGQARGNRDVRSAARHMLKYLVDHGYLKVVDLPVNLG